MENFSYDVFDRQLRNQIAVTEALVGGWDDIMTVEMTLDLKSLCLKASRLCAMADADYALQQQDLAHLRTERNREWEDAFNDLMFGVVGPWVGQVMEQVRHTHKLEGHHSPMFPCQMNVVMPLLSNLLAEDDTEDGRWDGLVQRATEVEGVFRKHLKPTKFPGVDYRERFWMLYELYALLCYLLFHFRRCLLLSGEQVSEENAGGRLHETIALYAQSEVGRSELERFWMALRFDHQGDLSPEILQEAKTALRKEVPPSLQVCFMQHVHDLDVLASELVSTRVSPDDYLALIAVLAKWQRLDRELQLMLHPEEDEAEMYNEVFVKVRNGRRVDMKELRSGIARMTRLVTRKNHWFCLWSVLWHRGYLAEKNYGAFNRQMMHEDWFGKTKSVLRFTPDTLSDYSGYFTERQYPVWNQQEYLVYRDTHNKTKWSDSLCSNFQELCFRMNEELAMSNS